MEILKKITNNQLYLELSKEFYEREAVFAAAHKVKIDRLKITPVGDNLVGIYFESDENMSFEKLSSIANKFTIDVADEQLRLDLIKRNGKIRELIVQQAFSPIINIEKKLNK